MYLYKGYMAFALKKFVTPIFGYCNLSIPLLKHFIEDPPHKYVEALSGYGIQGKQKWEWTQITGTGSFQKLFLFTGFFISEVHRTV